MLYTRDKSTNSLAQNQEKQVFYSITNPLSASFYAIEKNGKKGFLDIHTLQEYF